MARPWIMYRHYARRMPPVMHAFGLFVADQHEGVCTFGPPPRMFNDGANLFDGLDAIPVFELNRLVIGDDLPENALSQFVAGSLKQLPKPGAVVSYADPNAGHHGYIYQATNWLYLGTTSDVTKYVNTNTGTDLHARSVVSLLGSRAADSLPSWIDIDEQQGKHRYLWLLGSKRQRKRLRHALTREPLPYPKGDNERYEPGDVSSQGALF